MSEGAYKDVPAIPTSPPARPGLDAGSSWAVLRWLLVAATSWFLLRELAPLLRPLLLAVFLAYVILPVRLYVQGQVRAGARHLILVAGLGVILAGLAMLTYGDVVDLSSELPRLHDQSKKILAEVARYIHEHIPSLQAAIVGTTSAEEQGSTRLKEVAEGLANTTAGVLVEAIQVLFYLALILVEAGRLPGRVRTAFADEQADRLLTMIGTINAAMASYLKVKVNVNLVLAVPVMLILQVFGVKYVVLWGVLTFFANFVPYLGSVVACALPILFAFLDRGFAWQPLCVTALLPVLHVTSAYFIEPAMTGKAVNLSPLVVLIALSFWGLCWGLTGMILAVPLTAMLKIILESASGTKPIAELMGE